MLYLIVCDAPPASHIDEFVSLAQCADWDIGVIATPAGAKFLDIRALEV